MKPNFKAVVKDLDPYLLLTSFFFI